MADLPTGMVTFLFTDIEGSTPVWEREPEPMRLALARHHAILRSAIAAQGGHTFKTIGDAFQAAFALPLQAVAAALAAQRALVEQPWETSAPIHVRMGVHMGPAVAEGSDYTTTHTLNRVARIMAAGHGGQILLSGEVADVVRRELPTDVTMRDMGKQRMKGMTQLEHLFQLVAPDLPAAFPPLNTLDTVRTNLPIQLTSFVGRENEIAEIKQLLANQRLVTLTGPGGTGKTRVALQVAAGVLEAYTAGVWLVELAPLADAALVPRAVASALGLREEAGRPILATLTDFLHDRTLLLLLDNCEHVIEACAQLADALLRACPNVRILASSREALGVAGEAPFRVPSLRTPDPRRLPPLETLTQYDAVRLFVERGAAVLPGFTMTDANALALAQVCSRLDGIPLALELAAARVNVLRVEQIASRLDDRFRLLTGGSRTAVPRQQTLRALIDWSYDLLADAERVLLRRLAVFVGGWTLEAAEAVCAGVGSWGLGMEVAPPTPNSQPPTPVLDGLDQYAVLDVLTQLVNKSLAVAEREQGHETRYRLLETIRQYALERLAASGEADARRRQHATYFLELAEQAEPWLPFMRPEREPWLERLEAEQDNLRAALEWFSEHGEGELGLRLAAALRWFWWQCFHWGEGRAWLEAVLAKGDTTSEAARAKALVAAGHLAHDLGDSTGRAYVEKGLALLRGLGDKAAIADGLVLLGNMVFDNGEYVMARACAEECLALFDEVSDKWSRPYAVWLLARIAQVQGDVAQAALYNEQLLAFYQQVGDKTGIGVGLVTKGALAQLQGNWGQAVALYAESLVLFRDVAHKGWTAVVLHNLGGAVLHQGAARWAAGCFTEGLAVSREIESRFHIAINLAGMAGVAAAQGHPEHSGRLFGAAEALFEAMGQVVDLVDRREYDRNAAIARAQLGEEAFAAAWAAGRAMTIEQAIAEALNH